MFIYLMIDDSKVTWSDCLCPLVLHSFVIKEFLGMFVIYLTVWYYFNAIIIEHLYWSHFTRKRASSSAQPRDSLLVSCYCGVSSLNLSFTLFMQRVWTLNSPCIISFYKPMSHCDWISDWISRTTRPFPSPLQATLIAPGICLSGLNPPPSNLVPSCSHEVEVVAFKIGIGKITHVDA